MGNTQIGEKEHSETIRNLIHDVDTFIKTMRYSYNKMESLFLFHTNKMKFKKLKSGGNEKQ